MTNHQPNSAPWLPLLAHPAAPPRVLVVEDDSNDAFLLKRAFTATNFPCSLQLVQDGQEAREYLEQLATSTDPGAARPCLLLLDLKMPRLDGFEFLEWLRQQPNLRRIVTVVLSTSGRPEDVNRAYDLGANCFLQKPLGCSEYLTLVRNLYEFWINLNRSSPVHPD